MTSRTLESLPECWLHILPQCRMLPSIEGTHAMQTFSRGEHKDVHHVKADGIDAPLGFEAAPSKAVAAYHPRPGVAHTPGTLELMTRASDEELLRHRRRTETR